SYTRTMVRAAIRGDLNGVDMEHESVFGLNMPKEIPGVPTEVLNPRNAWADKEAYDQKAQELAKKFKDNFEKFGTVDAGIS
ncbi:phosphoenolpyruvate carboxykinase (ATP), partial [Bacillus sp. SIMBA_161]